MRIGWSLLSALLFCGSTSALVAPAAHAEDDVAAILADLATIEAPCADEIAGLDAAVGRAPGDRAARRARGVCLYRLGRLELARTDLREGLRDSGSVTDVEALVVGAILEARGGQRDSSSRWSARARAVGGAEHPQVMRAQVVLGGVLGDYPTAWATLDRLLEKHPEEPTLRVAATELIALDPDGATRAAREAIGRRVETVTRHNRASSWLNAGEPAACLHEAAGALAEADPEDTAAIASLHVLAWRCGVASEQVGPATRHLKAMGRAGLQDQPPGTVIAHVRLLRDADQVDSALKLLRLVQSRSDLDRRDVATLAVGLYEKAGDLDRALDHATADASAVSRANLAKALHAGGRTADAVALLDRTCPQLDDPAGCGTWRDHLRTMLP